MRIRKTGYRFVSLLTAFMILCSCFGIFTSVQIRTKALEDIEIRSFGASFADGATLVDGKYVYTPEYSDPGHQFIYRVYYSLSGEGFFEPGEVEVRIPRHIVRDRSGSFADECELSIPSKQEIEDYEGDLAGIDTNFVYEYDGDEVVITNFRDGDDKMKAGSTGYIEVGYRMTKYSYYYKDMAPSDPFTAELNIYHKNNETMTLITSAQDDAEEVCVNTYATLVSTNKRCLNLASPYQSWQDSWGTAPENADDYYYLVWELRSYIGAVTQPYRFEINDVVAEEDAEAIAYKLWGTNEFRAVNYQDDLRAERFVRYDYVITRHLKSTYEPLDRYKITNTETAKVTPKDNVDPATSASSTDVFTYVRTGYSGPGGYFYHRKWGNNNWWYRFGYRWEIADYGLQDLRDGIVDHLSGDIKFFVETASYSYRWTLEEGASTNDLDKYGKRKVTSTLTDDSFYLNDSIEQTEDLRVIIPENTRQLTSEDFSIEYVNYTVNINDAKFNEQDRDFVASPVIYNEDDVIRFYGKFGSSNEWVLAGTYDYYTRTADFDSRYVSALNEAKIVFNDNCVGYRIEVSNAHYSTTINAYPYCRIKNSDYIMEQAGDNTVEKIWLTNVSDYEVRDSNNAPLHQSRSMARDYIIGVEKIIEFDKRVITTRSNTINRVVTVGWKITLSEYYMSNYGIVYIPQDQGTFYDLLPEGCVADLNTVAVSVGEGDYHFLDKSEYKVSTVHNYHNTGRTLLKVVVKEQFSRAHLTFNTKMAWDTIIDLGTELHNSVAYETDNERITGGSNDDGGDIRDSAFMAGLDPECDGDRFIYTEHDSQLRFLVASFTGLYKKVSSGNMLYSESARVRQNSEYFYTLRYSTSAISRAKDMIFYDSLENFIFEDKHSEWHGTLKGVNVKQAIDMGIAPVVYYSSVEDLDLEAHHDLEETVNGNKIWKTEEEFGDISAAKAIAVDLRHDAQGNDYVLDLKSAVSVEVIMLSPETDETGSDDPVCFNNVYMSNTVIDLLGNTQANFIHQDNTEVYYRVMGDFSIEKKSSEHGNPVIKGIEFTLEGVSDYGTVVKQTETTDKYGHISFENIEKGHSYDLYESAGSDDYLPINHVFAVVVDDRGNVTIDGQPVSADGFYNITDDPRIHTDIEFFKRDLTRKQKLIEGTKFLLEGRSVYGNTIGITADSDSNGKVTFRNIEKGSYTLTELNAADGYIKSDVTYKVRIDDNAHFFITSEDEIFTADTELNGTISVYNEPYHSFTLQKEGTIKIDGEALPVRGAEYRFWGASDYGTDYDITKTTQSNGRIYFDDLEAGTYHLKETQAPEGYELDTTEYLVEITPEDEITIKGGGRIVSRNNMGYYVFTDTEKGTITITKKWVDTPESLAERLENETTPVIHISTEPRRSEAYFRDNNVLGTVAGSKANILYFKPYLGNDDYALDLISNGTAKRIDDRTTDYKIYGWYISDENAEDYKTVYWWSDAKYVYLKPGSYQMWAELRNIISIDVTGINTSKLTKMDGLFGWCRQLKELKGYENFDTSNAITMANMFTMCQSLTYLDLSNWDTANVTDMGCMFGYRVDGWGTDLTWHSLKSIDFGDNFDTSKVTDMSFMFAGCSSLTELDLSGFDTSNVTTMAYMFSGNPYAYPNYGKPMNIERITLSDKFDTSNVKSMYRMFFGCRKLETLDLSLFDTGNCTTMYEMFYDCNVLTVADVSNFDTTKVTNMYGMFSGCNLLSTINVSGFDTQNVTDMAYMFDRCNAVTVLDVSRFKTQNVTNMAYMFSGCGKITELDVTHFVTTNVTNMAYMFNGCSGLAELDVTHFDTQNVTTLEGTFQSCSKLKRLDLSNFNTSKVTNLYATFRNCTNLLELDLRSFDTSLVTIMEALFSNCIKIVTVDLSSFDNTKVSRAFYFFFNCQQLKTVYVSERWTEFSNSIAHTFFTSCTNIVGCQNTHFNISHTSGDYARIDNPPDAPGYFWYKPAPTTGSGTNTVTSVRRTALRTTSSSAGTAYSSEDENCSIKVISEDTWEYTFTSIPPEMQFYVWEDELAGYSSENMGEVNHKAVVDGRATIINIADGVEIPEEHFGSLTLKKLVEKADGTDLTPEQTAKKFTFTVKLYDENSQPVTETALYGMVAYGRNGATITLANNEEVTMTGIPAGYTYTVTETSEAGYNSQVTEGAYTGVITADETIAVTYTNTLEDETLTSFRLKKALAGNYELADESYTFLISLSGLQSGKTYSITGDLETTYTANENGTAQKELELKKDEEITVELPVGAEYSIMEQGGDYTAAYKLTDPSNIGKINQTNGSTMNKKNTPLNTALETADEGESVLVTFTNTKDARQDLTLLKTVINAASDEQFEFTADLINMPPFETIDVSTFDSSGVLSSSYRESADANGRIEGLTLYLAGNEKIVFTQLPVGTKYRISEAASYYKAAYQIVAGQTVLANAENELSGKSLTTGEPDEQGVYTDEGMNVIHEGGDLAVTFTNTKVQHDISITKIADLTDSVMTYSERTALEFAFTVSLTGLSPETVYNMEYTKKNTTGVLKSEFTSDGSGNAVLELSLKDGMTCKLLDLPLNAEYTVTEAACPRFIAAYSIEGNNGSRITQSAGNNTVTKKELSIAKEAVDANDNDIRITFTNTYTASDFVLPSAGFDDARMLIAAALAGMLLFAAMYFVSRRRDASQ